MGERSRVAASCVVAGALFAAGCTSGGSFSFYEENDALGIGGANDRYYTQGARASWVYPTESAPEAARRVAEATTVEGPTTEAIALLVGQSIYTPQNLHARRLVEDDRPYAGWLYGGIAVSNVDYADDGRAGDAQDTWELDLGVVGPHSYGQDAQERVHGLIDSQRPHGWDNQLHDEAGVVLSYEHRLRLLALDLPLGLGFDTLGAAGARVGNVHTDATGDLTLRFGGNLPRDFGVNTISRTSTEIADPDATHGFSWFLFAGADGWAVARNVFLDGNTFRDSHSVDKHRLVGELKAGLALTFGNWRLAYTQLVRSKEFHGQDGTQRYGSVSLQYVWDF